MLTGSRFVQGLLVDGAMPRATCERVDFTGSLIANMNFTEAMFAGAMFEGSHWFDCVLAEADLASALFADAIFSNCDLRGAKLPAICDAFKLPGCDMRSLVLSGMDLNQN